jgi:hypothetical protein
MWSVAFIALSACPAIFCDLKGWGKMDLDRFLFFGTALGFMLSAGVIELLGERCARIGHGRWTVPLAGAIFVASTIASPVAYQSKLVTLPAFDGSGFDDGIEELHRRLAAVGPNDLVRSDYGLSDRLVWAGFIVDAPMPTRFIGRITDAEFYDYMQHDPPRHPDWLLLQENDPRVAHRPATAFYGHYKLVRADGAPTNE